MRILAIEDRPGAGADDVRQLRAEGNTVLRCYGAADRPFPCLSLTSGCPLDGPEGIDVVLDSRAGSALDATAGEAGGVCALQRGIPVLVHGAVDPFPGWSVVRSAHETLADGCHRAIQIQRRIRAQAIEDEVARLLAERHPEAPWPAARVTRDGRRTSIQVTVGVPLGPTLGTAIAARVHAVHRSSGSPEVIVDVSVVGLGEP